MDLKVRSQGHLLPKSNRIWGSP